MEIYMQMNMGYALAVIANAKEHIK